MKFEPPLQSAILIKRYKRFLADVQLPDGSETTLHCPNTGSMLGCNMPESIVWFSHHDNPKRKYPGTWEYLQLADGHMVGINTHRANLLVKEALENKVIQECVHYRNFQSEVPYGVENSRIDFLASNEKEACYIEVKNVTLAKDGIAYFPDAITTRGTKHLRELMHVMSEGKRAMVIFCVQHTGAEVVKPAFHIDPNYSQTLLDAVAKGVVVVAYRATLSPKAAVLTEAVPVSLQKDNTNPE